MSKSDLKLDWASYKAAKYACLHWHYSQCMPKGKLVKCGVWEKGNYIGVIIYGIGANNNLLKPFDLTQSQGCELVRIALNRHENSVSRMIAISLKMIKKFCPGIKLIVSFADKE